MSATSGLCELADDASFQESRAHALCELADQESGAQAKFSSCFTRFASLQTTSSSRFTRWASWSTRLAVDHDLGWLAAVLCSPASHISARSRTKTSSKCTR